MEIKPIYQELQSILSQMPKPDSPFASMRQEDILPQIDSAIDRINVISGKDYSEYKITDNPQNQNVSIVKIRTKLGGLIDKLHGEYFTETEDRPFSGNPARTDISLNNTQSQLQSQTLSVVLDINDRINEASKDPNLKPEEKGFLEKLKTELRDPKDLFGILSSILTIGEKFGLAIPAIIALLGIESH